MFSVPETADPRLKRQPPPPAGSYRLLRPPTNPPETSESSWPIIRSRSAQRVIQVFDFILLTRFCAPKGRRGAVFARLAGNARGCAEGKTVWCRATTHAVA